MVATEKSEHVIFTWLQSLKSHCYDGPRPDTNDDQTTKANQADSQPTTTDKVDNQPTTTDQVDSQPTTINQVDSQTTMLARSGNTVSDPVQNLRADATETGAESHPAAAEVPAQRNADKVKNTDQVKSADKVPGDVALYADGAHVGQTAESTTSAATVEQRCAEKPCDTASAVGVDGTVPRDADSGSIAAEAEETDASSAANTTGTNYDVMVWWYKLDRTVPGSHRMVVPSSALF